MIIFVPYRLMMNALKPVLPRSLSWFSVLPLLLISGCDFVTDPPELIQEYASVWTLETRPPEDWQVSFGYSSSLRLLPDGQVLVSTAYNIGIGDGYATRFLKVTPEGMVSKEATVDGYAGFPVIATDGTIVALSDSLRRFSTDLEPISVYARGLGRFGMLAFNDELMLYSDYMLSSMALAAYDFSGNQLWSKPARAMGCGGNLMLIDMLGPNAGMFARSVGPETDTLRFSAFRLSDGKSLWTKTYMSDKLFGPNPVAPRLVWKPEAQAAWVFAGDGVAEKIHVRSISRDGIGTKFTADLSGHPFEGLLEGFRTVDNGFLFGLNGNLITDAYAYRLAKTDARGNVGWVGTFTTPGIDFLVDMLELQDGTVIVLTGRGTVSAYKPQY